MRLGDVPTERMRGAMQTGISRWPEMPRPSISPQGAVLRGHFSYPPEMADQVKALADAKKLSKACCWGIRNYKE